MLTLSLKTQKRGEFAIQIKSKERRIKWCFTEGFLKEDRVLV